MLPSIPLWVSGFFLLTTGLTAGLLLHAFRQSFVAQLNHLVWPVATGIFLWIAAQSVLSISGFYVERPDALPLRLIVFGVLPPLILFLSLGTTSGGRRFLDALPIRNLIWIHVLRIPVELVLYALFLQGAVPEIMTFTGRNLDILAGLTAPFVAVWGWRGTTPRRWILLFWNLVALALLLNIIYLAVFSTPFPLQQFAFDQPNIAVLYFPFSLLPAFIVPVVLFCHLVTLRKLILFNTSIKIKSE